MAAIADIVVKDSAGVDITFKGDSVGPNTAQWVYKPPGKSMLEWIYLKLERTPVKNRSSGALLGSITFEYPQADPTTRLLIASNRDVEKFSIPVRASEKANLDMAAFAKGFNADAQIQAFRKDGSLPT